MKAEIREFGEEVELRLFPESEEDANLAYRLYHQLRMSIMHPPLEVMPMSEESGETEE